MRDAAANEHVNHLIDRLIGIASNVDNHTLTPEDLSDKAAELQAAEEDGPDLHDANVAA
eukprot:COSAG02_NODE_358_length_23882_cov_25.508683_13_plen_59_part_00